MRLALQGAGWTVIGLDKVMPNLSFRERGASFAANARSKAVFYSRRWDGLTLAEDSGLEIDALGGAPGIRSARFSAPRPSDAKNIRKVLALLGDRPASTRKARFVCVLVLARGGRIIKEFRGEVRGRIAPHPRGRGGFGYDPIFLYPPLGKTFAEIDPKAKSAVSHRGRALRRLGAYLRRNAGLSKACIKGSTKDRPRALRGSEP